MMALHFILREKVLFKEEMPLLSAYDVREIMLRCLSAKSNESTGSNGPNKQAA